MHRNSGWAGHAYMIVAGALVGFALILQFYLTANLVVAQGGHLVTAMLVFLDFFTILTNILVLAALTAPWIAPESRLAAFFRRPVVLGAIASYIAIVGIVYTLLLLDFRASEGPPLWADVLLHDISPVLFVIYWLLLVPRGWLHWRHPVLWLGYPLSYVVYAMLRSTVTNRYPYPFIDVAALGYARVFCNVIMLSCGFLIVGLVFVAIDRILSVQRRLVV